MVLLNKAVLLLGNKLLERLRKMFASYLLTSLPIRRRLDKALNLARITFYPMVSLSLLILLVSSPLRLSSTLVLSRKVMKPPVCIKCATNLLKSVTSIFVEISMVTLSSLVVLLSMRVSPTDLRRNSMLFALKEVWSRLLLKRIVTTLYGLVVLLLLHFLLLNHNGLLNKNMRKMVLKSSIENAYELTQSLDFN